MSTTAWICFLVAAAVGAPLRYLVDGAVGDRSGGVFPWGTFAVNATGSFIAGLVTGWALYHGLPESSRLVLAVGFCGAYTTFSAFTFETVRLAEERDRREALLNVIGTALVAATAAAGGLALAAI